MTKTPAWVWHLTNPEREPPPMNQHLTIEDRIAERARTTHKLITVLMCERTQYESQWTPSQETPFCPHCGQRLIESEEGNQHD